jgi:hydroxymethylpyrimidine kinase/phosphomethylpyrimidine kinase
MKRKELPSALTIAGSDSGGGAGIQADLKTFAALGIHGTSAITCLTAQNPKQVLGVHAAPPEIVRDQISAVLSELPPAAIKTGMLYSAQIIKAVVEALRSSDAPLVVDPVMLSTCGAQLLKPDAVALMQSELFSRAELVSPNLSELEFLLQIKISTAEQLRTAARGFYAQYRCAVLAKGGHLRGGEALDFFYDGRNELMFRAPRTKGISTHGTGCAYSAAITAYRARGYSLIKAITAAKRFISSAIARSYACARHHALGIIVPE